MDEVSEFDTREVAQNVCPFAPAAATVATARPMSMAYYLQACGRTDLQIVPLYDTHYAPRDGDLIVLEPSRRFFETQRFFDALENSGMPHSEIRVGPVLASTIYLFDPSVPGPKNGKQDLTLTQLWGQSLSSTQKLKDRQTRTVLLLPCSFPGGPHNDSVFSNDELLSSWTLVRIGFPGRLFPGSGTAGHRLRAADSR
jgi:hypothetical protein